MKISAKTVETVPSGVGIVGIHVILHDQLRMGKVQLNLPKDNRIEPFLKIKKARNELKLFSNWLDRERPDVHANRSPRT